MFIFKLNSIIISILLLCIPATVIHDMRIDLHEDREEQFFQILLTEKNINKKWNSFQVEQTVDAIQALKKEVNLSYIDILALIAIESEFKFWVQSKNSNGSLDYGLTQQNSRYVQYRCFRVLKRFCSERELFNPEISIKLMGLRFKECLETNSNLSNINLVNCYNSNKNINRDTRYIQQWRKAKSRIQRLWNKHYRK